MFSWSIQTDQLHRNAIPSTELHAHGLLSPWRGNAELRIQQSISALELTNILLSTGNQSVDIFVEIMHCVTIGSLRPPNDAE